RVAALPLREEVVVRRRIAATTELGVEGPRVAALEPAIDANPVRARRQAGDRDADAEARAWRRRAGRRVEDLAAERAFAELVVVERARPGVGARRDPAVHVEEPGERGCARARARRRVDRDRGRRRRLAVGGDEADAVDVVRVAR